MKLSHLKAFVAGLVALVAAALPAAAAQKSSLDFAFGKGFRPTPVLFLGKTPAGGGSYPAAVVSAGAQTAWDLNAANDANQTGHLTPTAVSYCQSTYGGLRTLTSAPTGWSIGVAGYIRSLSTALANTPILECYNTNGRAIGVSHAGLTVRYNYVWADGSYSLTNINGIQIAFGGESNITGVTVEYNTVDGRTGTTCPYGDDGSNCDDSLFIQVGIAEHASATGLANNIIRGNKVFKQRDDAIKLRGAGNLVELNWLGIGGVGENQAHSDNLDITSAGTGIVVQDNWFDITPNANSFGRTSAIALSIVSDITLQRNIIGYGADVADNGYVDNAGSGADWNGTWGTPGERAEVIYSTSSSNSNIQFLNNVVMCKASGETNACFFPTTRKGISAFTDNYYLTDGDLLVYPGNN